MVVPRFGTQQTRSRGGAPPQQALINFDLTPEDLESYLDEYVIGQREAKAVLSTKICTHFRRVRYMLERGGRFQDAGFVKNNVIMIGPTGVGKTYMVKLLAQKLGVPFVKGDATKFSETGYVGGDVEDLIRDLVHEADGDIERAQFGIVYLDEIDKIASSGNLIGPDVSRTGVQRALLKPLEETEVDLRVPHDPISQLEALEHYRRTGQKKRRTINTRYVLFVVSGAFSGLEEIIKKRLHKQGLGFMAEVSSKNEADVNYLRFVKTEDLIEYGFESEFVGRLPVITVFDPLTVDELYEILCNPNSSVIVNKKRDFRAYGINLVFEDEALKLLAIQAEKEKTGARALVRVIERALIPFEKRLPSLRVRFLVVTKELIEDPQGMLATFEANPHDPSWEARYQKALEEETKRIKKFIKERQKKLWRGKGIKLTPERMELAIALHRRDDFDLHQALEELFILMRQVKNYERSFERRTGFKVAFSDEAMDLILKHIIEMDQGVYAYCDRILNLLEYGLRLVNERTGQTLFTIPKEAIEQPDQYLNSLIRHTYSGKKS
ncbi:AAA family ATPase [Thermodesulfatator autotrophicus]|uniref:ATPase n=1 Tax=Thermodesulfatator autotrophicus TaxID=1795632 RepID=A0A177E9R8_9BACT|nr:AAA family ATPase [Thermodesulfatator autotrophicus]OAG28476.1 ATPase [Thermodesulfatator autotrophicus]